MRFHFTDDQLEFQRSVRDFLESECTAEHLRKAIETETGRSLERWAKLTELGVVGILVPEEHGGLDMSWTDLVLPLEESGRAALPEPLVETAAVAAPLLVESGSADLCETWLPRIASGNALVAVGHPINPCVADAHVADLLLLERGGDLVALERADIRLEHQPANDPARRLFRVEIERAATPAVLARGSKTQALLDAALDRAALGSAAQQVGIAQRLVDMAVDYAKARQQFGKPIGSFQAIKHMLASVQVAIEFARPLLYRAACSMAALAPARSVDVSLAKAASSDAALAAAKAALQVHGAIGYTWEVDLHFWMKRAWALEAAWGTSAWHRGRVADAVLGSGPAPSFGFQARREATDSRR
jgi:alkylation response protein AidB-like acyl-CoA dehydrogenase